MKRQRVQSATVKVGEIPENERKVFFDINRLRFG